MLPHVLHGRCLLTDHVLTCALHDALQVDFLGRQIWQKEVGFKGKTYSFFWATDVIACARSSAGTLTLMKAMRS